MTEKPKPMIKISVETISLGFSEWIDRVAACMAFFWNSVNGHRGFMSAMGSNGYGRDSVNSPALQQRTLAHAEVFHALRESGRELNVSVLGRC